MNLSRSVSILAFVTAALSASAQNLVTNGSFETLDFTGWTVMKASTGSTLYVDFDLEQGAPDGQYIAFFGASEGQDDAISQSIATNVGTTYTVSFALRANGVSPDTSFVASFGGKSLDVSVVSDLYATYSFTTTATAAATTLTFQGRNADSFYRFDNVSVVAQGAPSVPGPLAALPFALLALRRRKRA